MEWDESKRDKPAKKLPAVTYVDEFKVAQYCPQTLIRYFQHEFEKKLQARKKIY